MMRASKLNQLCRWLGPSHGVGKAFFLYILTDTGRFITQSSVIPIDEHELTTDHMTKQCKNFMKRVEAKIVNAKKPLFDGTDPYRVYYSAFGDTNDAEKHITLWGRDTGPERG